MKLKRHFLSLICVLTATLVGCGQTTNGTEPNNNFEKFKVSFGSLIDTTYTDIIYGDLFQKVNYKENMVVVTYPGKDTTCSCWRTFEYVLQDYAKNRDAIIYAIDVFEIIGKYNGFGLTLPQNDPSIAFFKEGKLVKEIVYSVVNTPSYFKNSADFFEFMDEHIIQPDLIYVKQSTIDEAIERKDNFIISHTYSDCSDCTYVLPNVLMPYVNNNSINTKIWVIDLNDIHKDQEKWQTYKDTYNLSTQKGEKFGYKTGVVPTFQYYNEGVLTSSSVFFNDSISKVDGKYVVTESFYSNERKNNLPYIQSVQNNNVLIGLEVSETDVVVYEEYNYIAWNHDSARAYHEPLLKAFLDTYAK